LASAWNGDLVEEWASAVADEYKVKGSNVILGPGKYLTLLQLEETSATANLMDICNLNHTHGYLQPLTPKKFMLIFEGHLATCSHTMFVFLFPLSPLNVHGFIGARSLSGLTFHRVARGGRNAEYGTGEDPLLGERLAPHYVKGFQSKGILTTMKHYGAVTVSILISS